MSDDLIRRADAVRAKLVSDLLEQAEWAYADGKLVLQGTLLRAAEAIDKSLPAAAAHLHPPEYAPDRMTLDVDLAAPGSEDVSVLLWGTRDERGDISIEGQAVFRNRWVAEEIVRRWRTALPAVVTVREVPVPPLVFRDEALAPEPCMCCRDGDGDCQGGCACRRRQSPEEEARQWGERAAALPAVARDEEPHIVTPPQFLRQGAVLLAVDRATTLDEARRAIYALAAVARDAGATPADEPNVGDMVRAQTPSAKCATCGGSGRVSDWCGCHLRACPTCAGGRRA